MLLGRRTADVAITGDNGRVRHIAVLGGRSLVTVDGPAGPRDVSVGVAPDPAAARAATAGLRRLQWAHLHLDEPVPTARLAGTTRYPQVRTIPVAAALALAEQGLPTYVTGEGD